MSENNVQILSDREHVLRRPATYIGSMAPETFEGFIFNQELNKFEYKSYQKIQAFEKIVNEILDNSVDEALRTGFKYANIIEVIIEDNGRITIKDNGRGVPISLITDEKGKQVSQLEAAFTRARAGSNFSDENRQTIGTNGLGSFCTAVFSKEFQVKVQTVIGKGKLICKDNLLTHKCTINLDTCDRFFTEVSFLPDYEKFGLINYSKEHQDLLYTRLLNLSVCYPQIKFKFNGKVLNKLKPEAYLSYFGNDFEQVKGNSKYILGILPNDTDNFIQSSYVDGLNIKDGGNHIDFILDQIISRLRVHRSLKKYNVTPGDIRNKIKIVCVLREFPNMQFNSQTKEKLTNSVSEIRDYFKDIDWDKFTQQIAKNDKLIDPIVVNYKIKEQFKQQMALKNAVKVEKNFKCDKYLPAIKEKKYFIITEGDSASGGLTPALGRSQISFFSTRGVPLNAYTSGSKELSNNEELTNIIKALNLDISNKDEHEITHKYIVLAEDADADGAHIRGLYVGFFLRYAKWLLESKRLKYLKTPIAAILQNKKIVKYWFTLKEMNEYLSNNAIKSNQTLKYYKGLGSWRADMLSDLINNNGGLETFLEDLNIDEESEKVLDDWIGEKPENVLSRKDYLRNYQLDINKV